MKLRTILTAVMAVVGALAITAVVALVVLTSVLHDAGLRIATAVERVRLVMDLESRVLEGLEDGASSTADVPSMLADLRKGADPELARDVDQLERLLAARSSATTTAESPRDVTMIVAALRAVAEREEIEARRAVEDASRWNRTANGAGLAIATMLIVCMAAAFVWLWRSAFRPLLGVAAAIERLARGQPRPAPEQGPEELRTIAVAFNNMTASLSRQREEQLAFIGGVAHDLRTPLSAMRVGMAVIERKPQDAAEIARKVARQVDRMDRMVSDLLDSSRIESGQLELRLDTRDLRDVVLRVVELQQESRTDRRFVLSVCDAPVPVRCDVLRIEQVLNNLLNNAVKYSPEASDVLVMLSATRENARLSVTDHGVGIPMSDRDRIFEPFSRGANVGAIAGVGLGLSVSRRIVLAHGGSIDVDSTPGAGSTFTVELPLARVPPAPSAGADPALSRHTASGVKV